MFLGQFFVQSKTYEASHVSLIGRGLGQREAGRRHLQLHVVKEEPAKCTSLFTLKDELITASDVHDRVMQGSREEPNLTSLWCVMSSEVSVGESRY